MSSRLCVNMLLNILRTEGGGLKKTLLCLMLKSIAMVPIVKTKANGYSLLGKHCIQNEENWY